MNRLLDKTDRGTLLILLAMTVISVIAVASATHTKEPFWGGSGGKQLVFAILGFAVYFVVQRIDYHDWAGIAFLMYWCGVALLAVTYLMHPISGNRAWIVLGPLRLQPSEPMKALTVLAAAAYLANNQGRLDFKRFATLGMIVAVPMLVIVKQPDMGTAITFIPLFLGMAWVAGLRPKVLVTLGLIGLMLAPVAWYGVLKPYQKERIVTVFEPDRDPMGIGYQTIQSRIAVGSGEILGKGPFQGSQSRLEYLPARETDFILGVIGEETGFVGILVVLGLEMALLMRTLKTAATSQDYLGMLVCTGIVAQWAGQIFINTGMVTGIMPTIGVPLPGISYGGSSLLATFLAFGLVSSVRSGRLVNA